MSIRLAATVIVCRQGSQGPELVMVQRSRKAGFFPSAWVFPGGRVDQADHRFPSVGKVDGLNQNAFAVAAVRECFEEAGFWLGTGVATDALRQALNDRTGTLPTDGSMVADLNRIRQWSWWITPDTEPKRYDTRFFLCCLAPEEEVDASHDNQETVALCWITPKEAVSRHEAGEMFMAPPTYLTVKELASYVHVDDIWRAAERRTIEPIQPIHEKGGETLEIVLPTHPNHPKMIPDLGCTSVVLQEGRWFMR
jgi:8-oxo-dGTP pyrophosphatase MutT (NUDIX family)